VVKNGKKEEKNRNGFGKKSVDSIPGG